MGGESSDSAMATAFTTAPIGVANNAWYAMVILSRHDLSENSRDTILRELCESVVCITTVMLLSSACSTANTVNQPKNGCEHVVCFNYACKKRTFFVGRKIPNLQFCLQHSLEVGHGKGLLVCPLELSELSGVSSLFCSFTCR